MNTKNKVTSGWSDDWSNVLDSPSEEKRNEKGKQRSKPLKLGMKRDFFD